MAHYFAPTIRRGLNRPLVFQDSARQCLAAQTDRGSLRNGALQFRDRFIVIVEGVMCGFS